LVLDSSVPPAALEGLDGFSHVWVLFKFHINVESGKQRKANEGTRYAAKVCARAFGCGAPTHWRIAWGFLKCFSSETRHAPGCVDFVACWRTGEAAARGRR
jgi:hypothetical protein